MPTCNCVRVALLSHFDSHTPLRCCLGDFFHQATSASIAADTLLSHEIADDQAGQEMFAADVYAMAIIMHVVVFCSANLNLHQGLSVESIVRVSQFIMRLMHVVVARRGVVCH